RRRGARLRLAVSKPGAERQHTARWAGLNAALSSGFKWLLDRAAPGHDLSARNGAGLDARADFRSQPESKRVRSDRDPRPQLREPIIVRHFRRPAIIAERATSEEGTPAGPGLGQGRAAAECRGRRMR